MPKRKIRNDNDNYNLFIWNPSTRKSSKRLPNCYDLDVSHGGEHGYGFGYDKSTDDFKIIELYLDRSRVMPGSNYKVRIYSVKTGKWKNLGYFPRGQGIPSFSSIHFSNGAFYWLGLNKSSSLHRIIFLDLEKETYREVLLPHDEAPSMYSLGVLGESLCMVAGYRGIRGDVWVMKDHGVKDSWDKLYSIPYPINGWSISVPYFISDDGKLLLKFCRSVGIYDSKNSSYSEIMNFSKGRMKGYTIVESLISPDAPWNNTEDLN